MKAAKDTAFQEKEEDEDGGGGGERRGEEGDRGRKAIKHLAGSRCPKNWELRNMASHAICFTIIDFFHSLIHFFEELGMEPRSSCMLSKCSTTTTSAQITVQTPPDE